MLGKLRPIKLHALFCHFLAKSSVAWIINSTSGSTLSSRSEKRYLVGRSFSQQAQLLLNAPRSKTRPCAFHLLVFSEMRGLCQCISPRQVPGRKALPRLCILYKVLGMRLHTRSPILCINNLHAAHTFVYCFSKCSVSLENWASQVSHLVLVKVVPGKGLLSNNRDWLCQGQPLWCQIINKWNQLLKNCTKLTTVE